MILGRTANGLYWLFRYIERAENVARLCDTGTHVALMGDATKSDIWPSLLRSAGVEGIYPHDIEEADGDTVTDFLLRDRNNPSSVMSCFDVARSNARMVRTALTRDLWESINEAWMRLRGRLAGGVDIDKLPDLLDAIKRETAHIRGAFHGTMLRDERYDFCRLGTFNERLDNTARILDVKYFVLLPSASWVGGQLDTHQWESILRSVSAHRSYTFVYKGDYQPDRIAEFLILNQRMPRSLIFSASNIVRILGYLEEEYGISGKSHELSRRLHGKLREQTAKQIFRFGLHDFLVDIVGDNNAIAAQIAEDYRFYGRQ